MKTQMLRNVLAMLLAGLLLFGGTAKEVLHAWTGHQDTVHTHREDGHLVLEQKHHHCDFLSFYLAPFLEGSTQFEVRELPPVYGAHHAVPLYLWETRSHCFITGRGPPVA